MSLLLAWVKRGRGSVLPRDAQVILRSLQGREVVGADSREIAPRVGPAGITCKVSPEWLRCWWEGPTSEWMFVEFRFERDLIQRHLQSPQKLFGNLPVYPEFGIDLKGTHRGPRSWTDHAIGSAGVIAERRQSLLHGPDELAAQTG